MIIKTAGRRGRKHQVAHVMPPVLPRPLPPEAFLGAERLERYGQRIAKAHFQPDQVGEVVSRMAHSETGNSVLGFQHMAKEDIKAFGRLIKDNPVKSSIAVAVPTAALIGLYLTRKKRKEQDMQIPEYLR